MTAETETLPTLAPLNISCTRSDCENDLHCFRRSRRKKRQGKTGAVPGACQSCGEERVHWARVHVRDVADVAHTVENLRHEWIRNHFWEAPLPERAVNYALRKGRLRLREAVEHRVRTSVGQSSDKLYRDGTQTPIKDIGNPIHAAQHAMAACCRKCIEYWHDIPMERALTDEEVDYLTALLMHFIDRRLPDLPAEPTKVRGVKKARSANSKTGDE